MLRKLYHKHGILPWHLLTRPNLGIPPAKQIGATLLQSPEPTKHKRFSNWLNHWSFNVSEFSAFSKAGRPNPRAVHLINDRRGCIVDLTNVCQLWSPNDKYQEIKTYRPPFIDILRCDGHWIQESISPGLAPQHLQLLGLGLFVVKSASTVSDIVMQIK